MPLIDKTYFVTDCLRSPVSESQNQRKPTSRGKTEEPSSIDGTTSRRPVFESRTTRGLSNGMGMLQHISDTSDLCLRLSTLAPEDIVLGPPKTAFASSARNTNKTSDPPNRADSGHNDDDQSKDSHYNGKEKYSREGRKNERDGELTKESRQGTTQARRNLRDDNESWGAARQHKITGNDGAERPFRRNGEREHERDRDSGREPRVQGGFDNHRRDTDREGGDEIHTRRNGTGRGRFEAPWSRDGERPEADALDNTRSVGKTRDWRDKEKVGTRGADQDWNRSAKQEREPEWMDEPELEEKKQSHTQEDFERWKERMKASNGPVQESSVEQQPIAHERSTSKLSNKVVKGKAEMPLVVDPSFDGFFGLWNEPKDKIVNSGMQAQPANNLGKAITPKPSKFTGFFNPKPVPAEGDPEPPVPPLPPVEIAKDSSNEDKEGFQRILQLLDRQQPSAVRNGTPPREQLLRNLPASPPIQSPQSRDSANGLESLLASQANRDAPPQSRDSEFLLKLMQQTQQPRREAGQANFSDQRQGATTGPGTLPFSNLLISPRDLPRQTPTSPNPPPGLYSERTRDDTQRRDKLNPNSDRKGPHPGFYEVPNAGNTQRHPSVGQNQQPQLPIGLSRPPGLEQLPPSYSQFQAPRQNNIPPPPGFQAPLRNPNTFPPGLMANMPNPNDRGPPYVMRPAVNGPIGMPPPGFMNMNVPPPGFPPLPFNQEGRMSPSRMFLGAGAQRPPMDGYADAGSFQLPPGAYRRQD